MIVDTSALIAVLLGEPEADEFGRTLMGGGARLSSATLVEARIVAHSRLEATGARKLASILEAARAEVVPVDERQADAASEAYRRYGRGSGHPARLNFGDCFAYALATIADEPLLYKGDDFVHTDVRSALAPMG